MVNYPIPLDSVFQALSDPTRRDILNRVAARELSVNDIAECYDMSLAAISKHLKVLDDAQLIQRRKEGRSYRISLNPKTLRHADRYLDRYRRLWESRYQKLDALLK